MMSDGTEIKTERSKKMILRILEVSSRLFSQRGFYGASIGDITKAANITKGAIYGHFSGKADIFLALIAKFEKEFIDPLISNLSSHSGDALEKLKEILRSSAKYAERDLNLYSFIILSSHQIDSEFDDVKTKLQDLKTTYFKLISDVISEGQRQGLFASYADPELMADTFIALNEGSILEWRRRRDFLYGRSYYEALRHLLFYGMLSNATEGKISSQSAIPIQAPGKSPQGKRHATGIFTVGCPSLGEIDLDPAYNPSGGPYEHFTNLIYEGLMGVTGDNKLTMGLAEKYEISENGCVLTFKLRKGIRFHNGMPLTIEDVIYSIKRPLLPNVLFYSPVAATIAPLVISAEAVDELTVCIRLKEAGPHFLERLSDYFLIVPKKLYEQHENKFENTAIGTGPFKFVRKEGVESIILDTNEDYWNVDKIPRFGRLYLKVISDPAARWAALKSGEIDFARFDGTPFINEAQKNPGFQIFQSKNSWYVYLVPLTYYAQDHITKPFMDPLVRKAIILAIDRQTIIDTVWRGRGTVISTLRRPGARGYNPSRQPLAYDPSESRRLLRQAGYPNGFETEIHYVPEWIPSQAAEAIMTYLSKVGIKVKITAHTTKGYNEKAYKTRELRGLNLAGINTLHDDELWGTLFWFMSVGQPRIPQAEQIFRKATSSFDEIFWDKMASEIERLYWDQQFFMPIGVVDVIGISGRRLRSWATFPNTSGFMSPVMDYSGVSLNKA